MVAATPAFFGANPAVVKSGDRKGLAHAAGGRGYALELFASLDDDDRKVAFQAKQFPEIEQAQAAPHVGEPVGMPADKMNEKQQDLLLKLIEGYADRMPPDVAAAKWAEFRKPASIRSTSPSPRRRQAGQALHLSRPGTDLRDRVSERSGRRREEPGQSHPQLLAQPGG